MALEKLIRSLFVGTIVVSGSQNMAKADPASLDNAKKAVAIVIAKGVVPSLGNAPVAAGGTGFFVKKNYLVTAYHLRTDLGDVDPKSVTYEFRFGPGANDVVSAQPIFFNPVADVLVLFGNIGDRDVQSLKPADTSSIQLGVTPIFAVGYPEGIQYSVTPGVVTAWGTVAPLPVWTTNLSFKGGQSGSPILLSNGRVIAFAKGIDKDATSIGLIVDVGLVPPEYWDGSLKLFQNAALALQDGNSQALDKVVIRANLNPSDASRTLPIRLSNDHCAGSATKTEAISATPGWSIDPSTIGVKITEQRGAAAQVVVIDKKISGFIIAAQLSNLGSCVNAFGHHIDSDIVAEVAGVVSYTERAANATRELTTVAESTVIGNVRAPLPNIAPVDLTFALTSASGATQEFRPTGQELTTKGGRTFLDVGKVATRLNAVASQ